MQINITVNPLDVDINFKQCRLEFKCQNFGGNVWRIDKLKKKKKKFLEIYPFCSSLWRKKKVFNEKQY